MRSTFLLTLPVFVLLSACAGGGGGGSLVQMPTPFQPPNLTPVATNGMNDNFSTAPTVQAPAPFTTWAAANSGGVILSGRFRQAELTWSSAGFTISMPSEFAPGATLSEQLSGTRVTDIDMGANGSNFPFRALNDPGWTGAAIWADPRLIFTGDMESINVGYAADPIALAWNYQTFGIWMLSQIPDTPRLTGRTGAMSVGVETGAAAIPVTGTATYQGVAAGNYFGKTNPLFGIVWPQLISANVSATLDFGQRNMALSFTDSKALDGSVKPINELNLSGTLTWSPGANGFAGPVSTAGGGLSNEPLTGTANGMFFGPAANELGGVFWVGSGSVIYEGGFGAAK